MVHQKVLVHLIVCKDENSESIRRQAHTKMNCEVIVETSDSMQIESEELTLHDKYCWLIKIHKILCELHVINTKLNHTIQLCTTNSNTYKFQTGDAKQAAQQIYNTFKKTRQNNNAAHVTPIAC